MEGQSLRRFLPDARQTDQLSHETSEQALLINSHEGCSEKPGDIHAASHRFHLIGHHLAGFLQGVIGRREHEILQHVDVSAFDGLRVDHDTHDLHPAVRSDADHASTSRAGDGFGGGFFLQLGHLRLHGLRLLDKICHVAQWIFHSCTPCRFETVLTSASSAPNISRACFTTGWAFACSKSTSFCSCSFAALICAIVGPGGSVSVNSTMRSRTGWPLSRAHKEVSAWMLSAFSNMALATVACLLKPTVTIFPSIATKRPISRNGAMLGKLWPTSS